MSHRHIGHSIRKKKKYIYDSSHSLTKLTIVSYSVLAGMWSSIG